MIDVHFYGKLRRFASNRAPNSDSIVRLPHRDGDTVGSVVARLGIPEAELGANLFVDGRYATLQSPVADGARLGLFPDDMQLLYKWYFRPKEADS
ncbi:MAG: MoaD/ThiS family protein [Candidatus Bipolaricaulis sp.]|nr:MoaD/ThiS family protein [Candidatus Bipolaricaulis sp.]MDD5646093.1 MoaD/ThiS family protein [Candidatus Bipolaricaulis sp.]